MSVSIYDGQNDRLNQIAGREDTSFWEGTKAQWEALNASEKAAYTGKYVIITDDEEDVIEALAPAYSATSTYAKGDLCTNQGKLWQCKTAISTAHAWNASEWDDVTTSEAFLPQYELVNTYTSQSTDTWGDIIRSLCNVDLTPYSDAKIVMIANGLPAIIANVCAIQSNANRFSSVSGTATGEIEVLYLACFTTDNRGVASKLIANSTNGVTYTNLSDTVANYNFEWKLYARR